MPAAPRGLLAPGGIAVDEFPHKRWLQCLERAWAAATIEDAALRRAIATHVCPMRGIVASEDEIVIAAHREDALSCAAQLLADPGDLALVENPGDPRTRALLAAHGLRWRADRLDAEGLVFDTNAEAPRLVHLTPSRQFPAGVQMSPGRQYLLLQWAKSIGAAIVEEDRDGAWNDGDARAIKAVDNDGRVVYIGSFEKLLHPDAAPAFLILPRELVPLAERILVPPPPQLQSALASFIEQGELARHIQRMRGIYVARRDALLDELRRRLGDSIDCHTRGAALDVVLWLAPQLNDLAIAANSVGIAPLALNACAVQPGDFPPALVLGYGAVTLRDTAVAAEQLARAIERATAARLRA